MAYFSNMNRTTAALKSRRATISKYFFHIRTCQSYLRGQFSVFKWFTAAQIPANQVRGLEHPAYHFLIRHLPLIQGKISRFSANRARRGRLGLVLVQLLLRLDLQPGSCWGRCDWGVRCGARWLGSVGTKSG